MQHILHTYQIQTYNVFCVFVCICTEITTATTPPPPPQPQPPNQDNDSYDMTEERNLAPEKFKGFPSEDAKQWLNHLENYCCFKTYDDNKKLNLALVLMTAGAALWLETLTTADKQTWAAFKAKFCSRYLQPEYIHFRAAKLLFNTKQQPLQTISLRKYNNWHDRSTPTCKPHSLQR